MARRCALTGKGPRSGNNVSHSHKKTKRRFLPNLQDCTLQSAALGRRIRLRISTSALRTVTKYGGIDGYLMKTADAGLTAEALRIKKAVRKALQAPAKPATPAA